MKTGLKKQLLGTDILLVAIYLGVYFNVPSEYEFIYGLIGLVGLILIVIGFFL